MKSFLRNVLVNFFSLQIISKAIGGIEYGDNLLILFWAGLFLAVLNLLVKPLLNILLAPINFLTLGASRWFINLMILLLVTLLVPEFKIVGISLPGFSRYGFSFPQINLTFFWAVFLVSFLLELIPSGINWLIK